MKVLFVGLGSIGKRNLRSCLRVRPNNIYAALRSGQLTVSSDFGDQVLNITTLEEAREFKPDLIWVCNPTSHHAKTVSELATTDASFFVEKPLAANIADLEVIEKAVKRLGRPFFYGCVLRHHPLVVKSREVIQSLVLGKTLSYSMHCGSYLPDWRPGQDYRQVYSSKKELGGGVSLDLIHEFDMAEYFFGNVLNLKGHKSRLSTLELDTDDYCNAITNHESGVLGQIQLNYFRISARRDFEILFENGLLCGDFISGNLIQKMRNADGRVTEATWNLSIDRDALHDRQSSTIFETIEKELKSMWDLDASVELVKKIIALEKV